MSVLDIPVSRRELREGADSSDPTGDATPTTSPIIPEYRPALLYHPNADAGEKADHRQEQACCGVAGDIRTRMVSKSALILPANTALQQNRATTLTVVFESAPSWGCLSNDINQLTNIREHLYGYSWKRLSDHRLFRGNLPTGHKIPT